MLKIVHFIYVNSAFKKRIDELQSRLNDRTIEVTELRSKVARNGTISSLSSDSGMLSW